MSVFIIFYFILCIASRLSGFVLVTLGSLSSVFSRHKVTEDYKVYEGGARREFIIESSEGDVSGDLALNSLSYCVGNAALAGKSHSSNFRTSQY